ncbi:2,3-diaminopropionate biosynthesis protein SbnB [Actinoplanes sp. NPDC051346]|uniref:2,3-diaminopropionate biosynthesis protein SbnB n=1 Tax=Actinoplanes sp. NPDC051346 TaxID=3155048 RepID=UPI003422501A
MLVLTHQDLRSVLDGHEVSILDAVRRAYVLHSQGATAVPHSAFLRLPDQPRDGAIALPAFLGGAGPSAGVTWIASFPDNITRGGERASAAIILNSTSTGRPEALLEGSLISARRTAASAALAASALGTGQDAAGVTLVGCGVVNFETLRFLHVVHPDLREVTVHDLRRERAGAFAARVARELPSMRVRFEPDRGRALAAAGLVAIATTATTPYLDSRTLRPGTLILHTSLRDVTPEGVLAAVNVVDDADHVCRADTSLERAERLSGNRSFITANLGDLLQAGETDIRDPRRVTIFSPSGLGILDLAVARFARDRALKANLGIRIDDFLPGPDEFLAGRADFFPDRTDVPNPHADEGRADDGRAAEGRAATVSPGEADPAPGHGSGQLGSGQLTGAVPA